MTLPRRTVVVGGVGAALLAAPDAPAWTIPAGGTLGFRILRNDSRIGTHRLTFRQEGGSLLVRIASEIAVGLGPITFYRYTHRAEERWTDGVFASLDAETDDDGTVGRTRIRRDGDRITAEGRKAASYQAPPDALPLTHWNPRMLDGPVISTQTGELFRPVVSRIGMSQVVTAAGPVAAEHVTLRGGPDLDSWYDTGSIWAGLRLIARDGSVIRYERVTASTE
jgi:hypothetical protein